MMGMEFRRLGLFGRRASPWPVPGLEKGQRRSLAGLGGRIFAGPSIALKSGGEERQSCKPLEEVGQRISGLLDLIASPW
jgi:hypothetical protein